jgi:hypothetical protein
MVTPCVWFRFFAPRGVETLMHHAADSPWWIVLAGDSTQRQLYEALAHPLQHLLGVKRYALRQLGVPTLAGAPVFDNDHHKDMDTLVGEKLTVSLRFLRGLDLAKLELHARDWRQRYFYPDMANGWETPLKLLPLTMRTVLEADPFDERMAASRTPDVIILHSCVWDTPMVNRSRSHNPQMDSGRTCPSLVPQWAQVRTRNRTYVAMLGRRDGLSAAEQQLAMPLVPARVAVSPCVQRASTATLDDQIYADFGDRLHAAVDLIRSQSNTSRLILRTCCPGTNTGTSVEAQKELQLQRMNEIIEQVARSQRVELLDIFHLEQWASKAAGGASNNKTNGADKFHMPSSMLEEAAAAAAYQLVYGGGHPAKNELRAGNHTA